MSYIGNQPVLNTSEFREEFAVTSTQTVFNTGGFTASSDSATLEVLRNGVLLGTADYTLGSDASTVTLANAAVNGDIIVIKGRRELTNGVQVTERRHEHTMGSGETTVTFPYPLTVSQTDVYLNGVKLGSSDFSINSSTRVVSFTTNPAVGDLVAIVSREPALTANSSLPVVDAAGTNVLSESGGVVTLTADTAIIEGSSSGDLVRITQTGSGNALVVEDSANPDSTPFIVDSSGNVGIGIEPSNWHNGAIVLQIGNRSSVSNFSNTTQLSNNGYWNGSTWIYIANGYASNYYQLNGGHAWRSAASGTAGGTFTYSEVMSIDSSGNVKINNLSASSDVQTDASKNLITTSDARLKNDLGVITDSAINVVQQIIPKYFSWKNDENNNQQLGFFAQDIYHVLPEAAPRALKYTEVGRDENDEPILEQVFDENGNPDYEWGFTDRPIIAMCVKAIQEQQTLIESQQSQIDALTARIEALETPAE